MLPGIFEDLDPNLAHTLTSEPSLPSPKGATGPFGSTQHLAGLQGDTGSKRGRITLYCIAGETMTWSRPLARIQTFKPRSLMNQ